MVVAQLLKRLLFTSEIRGSNPVSCNFLFTVNCIERRKQRKQRPGTVHLIKKIQYYAD